MMQIRTNLLLWSLSVIQPASADEVASFFIKVFKLSSEDELKNSIHKQLRHLENIGYVEKVWRKGSWYSLTLIGNASLPKDLSRLRDKTRLFLLKKARGVRVLNAGGSVKNMADVSSAPISSDLALQDVPRPSSTLDRRVAIQGRTWSRLIQQNSSHSGSDAEPPALPSENPLAFYSYHSSKDRLSPASATDIALYIGVSPRLISSMMKKPERHYRTFEIPKKNGKSRQIKSPRVFLKTIQYWLNDYLLSALPLHPKCMAYIPGESIHDNAARHAGQNYVGCIDIVDFFGSISHDALIGFLSKNGFAIGAAHAISRLVTVDDSLPQGAPTSPLISNAFLFEFDVWASKLTEKVGLNYTRYADDIFVSGEDKPLIQKVLFAFESRLFKYGLKVNSAKTRVVHKSDRQVVTGLVVNSFPNISREKRRLLRSMEHRIKNGRDLEGMGDKELQGWLGFRSYIKKKNALQ